MRLKIFLHKRLLYFAQALRCASFDDTVRRVLELSNRLGFVDNAIVKLYRVLML